MLIDLNADVGEGVASDVETQILNVVTSASIACGGHAGDARTMSKTATECLALGVRIGAHPAYPDRDGFGRTTMLVEHGVLKDSVRAQVEQLMSIAEGLGASVRYIKPHGALYHDAANDPEVAAVMLEIARDLGVDLMCLAGSPIQALAHKETVGFISEGFADRTYSENGQLLARSQPGAVIFEPKEAAQQAVALAKTVDSLCIHSDTPNAPQIALAVRTQLVNGGWVVAVGT